MARKIKSFILRSELKPPGFYAEENKEKRLNSFKKNIYFLIILISIVWFFYFFLFSETFQMKKIITFDEEGKRDIQIENIVISNLKKDNFFIFKKEKYISKIREIVDLKKIDIKKKFPDTVQIYFEKRKPKVILVQQIEEGREAYFYLDSSGIILENIKDIIQLMPKIYLESNVKLNIGDKVISENISQKIQNLYKKLLPEIKIEPMSFFITKDNFVDLTIKTKNGFDIYLNLTQDPKTQLDNLVLFLRDKKAGELEYVDLRVMGRIYYKVR